MRSLRYAMALCAILTMSVGCTDVNNVNQIITTGPTALPMPTPTPTTCSPGQVGTPPNCTTPLPTPTPTPTPSPAPSLTFTVSPGTINAGQAGTLSWTSTNCTTRTASGGWSGAKDATGSQSVSPSVTTTYNLDCVGPGGTIGRSVTLVVNAPTPTPTAAPTCPLTANPMSTTAGQVVTLTWNSANATTVTRSWNSSNTSELSGSNTVNPTVTTTYTVTCTGPGGTASSSQTVTVASVAVSTCTLVASPTNINSGQSVLLTWNSANATSWSPSWGSVNQATGQFTVNPTSTTTYTLTCIGPGGSQTASATVTVNVTSTPSCTGTSAIDYSPTGGTLSVGQTTTLNAQNYGSCTPYWYTNSPSRVQITGATMINVGGTTYWAGPQGVLRAIASGTAQVCVQISLSSTTPSKCYTWTVN